VPTGLVHIDAALTNLSLSYLDQGENAKNIIREILPPFPSPKQSDVVWKYGQEIFVSEDDARAAGAEAKDSTWKLSTVNFRCNGHALRDKISRENENNADPALNLLADSTAVLTQKSSLSEEVAGAALIASQMAAAGYAQDQANQPWNSPDFDPYSYLKAQIDAIALQGGIAPNSLAISKPVWTAIRTNRNVVGLITGAPQVTNARVSVEQFAELLELDNLFVGGRVYATALGAAKSFIWGQKAMLFHRPPNPGLRTPALGYTPVWTNALAAVAGLEKVPGMDGQGDAFVQQYFWEPEVSDYVVVHRYYDQEIWMPELGALYTGCLGTAGA